jgi:hypothetical protein
VVSDDFIAVDEELPEGELLPEPVGNNAPADRMLSLVPLPDEDAYPLLYDATKHRAAYKLFIAERRDFPTISTDLGIPLVTVLRWAQLGDWPTRRSTLLRVQERDEAQQISLQRMAKRRQALADQAKVGEQLRRQVSRAAEDVSDPEALKFLADAAKSASVVSGAALGVDAAGRVESEDRREQEAAGGASGKQPLVVIVQGGGLPTVRRAAKTPVDVPDESAVQ